MFEQINILTTKAMSTLTQTLDDYDVKCAISTEIIAITEKSLINADDILISKYKPYVGKCVAKYIFQFRKRDFDNKNTVKIYHEIEVLFKKLKNSGCDASISESEDLIGIAAIACAVDINYV